MPLEDFGSGQYAGTYNAVSLGITEGGYEISHENKAEVIDKSDQYGDTMLDYIYRGGNVAIDFTCLAFKKGIPALWPFATTMYTAYAAATPMGRLASDIASALVLTGAASTPAVGASVGPATITASKSIIAPGFSTKHLYSTSLRKLPLRFQLLPYLSTTVIWATIT